MPEDVMTVETHTQPEPTTQPTIAQAYEAEHSDPTGAKRKPERAESGTNQTLADGESERQRRVAKVQPTQSLADAHAGLPVPEAEEIELPDGFSAYSSEDIEAVLGLMGLKEEDLQEPRFAALALKELEASFSPVESEDGEESESEDDQEEEASEEDAEKKPEPAKPEDKKAALPIPQSVEEYVGNDPAKLEVLQKHIDSTYQRARSMNDPVMTDVFVRGLAGALQTAPENFAMLKEVVDVLSYGGYALVEAAVPKLLPALVTEYLQKNFAGVMESYAPGFATNYTQETLSRTWDAVRGNDLPAFGTEEFEELAREVQTKHPFLNDIDFKDSKGNPLPLLDALRAKAELTARLCRGERVTPKTIQDAVARGRADAVSTNRRVSAQRSLGKGKSSGRIGGAESSGTSLRDAYNAEHGGVI